jgi:hypothetical protein
MELNAMTRLTARSALDHVRAVEKLFDVLKSRHVPAVLNKTDYTIGFKCDTESVLRALDLMGFEKHGTNKNGTMLSNGHSTLRVFEPREDWHPVLQVI